MDYVINIALLRNPLNWLSIGAMLLLIAFGAMAIISRLHTVTDAPNSDAGSVELAKEI